MSIGKKGFQAELEDELQRTNLPTDVKQIIGRLYRFGSEHGSHHHIIVGKIEAVEISDEGGLDLYVTSPSFWGERLISIKYHNDRWLARVRAQPLARSFFEGEFELL